MMVKEDFLTMRAQRGRISGWRQGTGILITRELSALIPLTRHLCFLYPSYELVPYRRYETFIYGPILLLA